MARQVLDLEVTYLHHTAGAVLIMHGGEKFWLPLSRIEFEANISDLSAGEKFDVQIPVALAEEKGIDP